MLPRRSLLEGAQHPDLLRTLIQGAETVLRTYQPCWSGFLSAPEREEAEARLGNLEELTLSSDGGSPRRNGGGCASTAAWGMGSKPRPKQRHCSSWN